MAVNEGTGQAELFPGWSSVVHQPCEDLEESELPSTVDMAAFTSGLSVEPTTATQNDNNTDTESDSEADSSNSGTDASQSSSQSESSDTENSSSSSSSCSGASPEFSITSSQTNVLRLKIHAVKKPYPNPPIIDKPSSTQPTVKSEDTSSSDSPCSSESDSESDSDNSSNKTGTKNITKEVSKKTKQPVAKIPEKKDEKKPLKKESPPKLPIQKVKVKSKKPKKMASLPVSRGSTCSSSDSEESDADSAMLASCSLQEIRQEDLAAILPDQQECDAFGGFDCSRADKNSPQVDDMSSSDMELPQQAVNALIQRTTESSSESECNAPTSSNSLYANSLLQQFVAQTQMLNTPTCQVSQTAESKEVSKTTENTEVQNSTTEPDTTKRRRGRPRKPQQNETQTESKVQAKPVANAEYNADPNVSPDSGIPNSPDHVSSPEPNILLSRSRSKEEKKPVINISETRSKVVNNKKVKSARDSTNSKSKDLNKLPVTANRFDRLLYGNADRILYPPRRKVGRPPVLRKGPGRPPKHKPVSQTVTENKQPEKTNKIPIEKPTKVALAKPVEQKQVRSRKGRKINNKDTTNSTSNAVNGVKDVVQKKAKSSLLHEICERVSKRLEMNSKHNNKAPAKEAKDKVERNQRPLKTKHRNRPVLATKNKMDIVKTKYTTLKNAKLMHSKHKHKKHKKCKFKILKPITQSVADPKINLEVEKLIADFVKLCVISTQKSPKENVPDVLKTLKKVTKKRKTTEERKKKKQNVTATVNKDTNCNEQRLPLKKRHYHLSANNDNKIENQTETSQLSSEDSKIDKTKNSVKMNATICNKTEKPKTLNVFQKTDVSKTGQASPKHIPVIKSSGNVCPKIHTLNNNDYNATVKAVGTHIDEAIEACIKNFSDAKSVKSDEKENEAVKEPRINTSITATTPKKRHRLEMATTPTKMELPTTKVDTSPPTEDGKPEEPKNKVKLPLESVVTELKHKRNLSPRNVSEQTKKPEKKIENVVQIITRKKNRLEDLASNLVSKISPQTHFVSQDKKKKEVKEEARVSVIKYPVCKKAKPTENEKLHSIASAQPTGIFMPTVEIELNDSLIKEVKEENKDKKDEKPETNSKTEETKKVQNEPAPSADQQIPKMSPESVKKKLRKRRAINRTGFPTVKKKKKKLFTEAVENKIEPQENNVCDRVPKEGEEYTKFVERTERGECSIPKADESSKWEAMSECDSLPQDERTEFDMEDLRPEVKLERMTLRMRDSSPATSVDTKSSDRREDDLDDLSLEARIERMKANINKKRKRVKDKIESFHVYPKRRLRDDSPASSLERHIDRKFRDERSSTSGDENRKNKKAPRWRKKYLVAGLFSDYYKEDDEAARIRRSENAAKSRFTYNPIEHPYGLLPPPYHCGKYLRCRRLPFQLPYDLWWQHTHSQLPGRDVVPSWNYRKIRTNIYNVKSTVGACEPQACNCSPSSNCGDDCINRLVLAECPANHRCQNQKIQRHEWAPGLEKFMTESKGWGVRTKLPIKTGDFILEYVGEVVSDQEFKERMATIYVNDTHHYCLHLDGGLVIDGHRMGGDGRFVNHSCKPNCEMQKWSVNGQFRMALFALRDIESGEELTYDYNFSLFNPAEGQECLCGSENCRGVIGGKSQRVRQLPEQAKPQPGRVGRPRKNQVAKKATNNNVKEPPVKVIPPPQPILPTPNVKLTHQQKCFILEHHCFLLRNLTKVRKVRNIASIQVSRHQTSTPTDHGVAFMNHLNALQKPRNIKTRRLAQAEDNPELNKSVKLAAVLRDILNVVTNAKDDNKKVLSTPFMTLPSKRKVPEFYQRITDPIDLTTVEQNIATGIYRTPDSFDSDMCRIFMTYCRFYGRTSDIGIAAIRLKKIYTDAKQQHLHRFEDVLGKKPPANFISNRTKNEEEDIIRCICGMYKDEGLMIQCERCLCWQHSECVKADISASYHCERCVPRPVDYEIPMDEFTEHGHRYYMTLMRGDLQLRQGDTVYVLRDIPIPGTDRKHTYDTIGKIEFSELDIFRIERLWKDSKTGQRFAYGHHYLRPHETYHEPTRKFFPNEVMRVPLYEAVPVELVICHCWVMDLNTYCKGRPIGAPEEHIYICEYRVDKSARLFSKVSKSKYPICTKSYAFERFNSRLKISRTYTPHEVDPSILKCRGRKAQENEVEKVPVPSKPMPPVHVPVVRTPVEQKARLNKILLNLLAKMPTKHVLDVSYLLEGGRRRKKQNDTSVKS